MKLKSTCLFVSLLVLASVAAAADSPVQAGEVEAAPPLAATAPNDLASNCEESKSAPFFRAAFEKPSTNLTAICTQCSVPQCIGAVVGRRCWTASGQLGNCNVFGTGGTSCESVGPDCECGIGVP